MKRNLLCLLILFGATISLNGQAQFKGCDSSNNIEESVKEFVNQYYEVYGTQNVEAMKRYYLKELRKEDLEHLSYVMDRYKIAKIEIIKMEVLAKNPMTVEVQVKEVYSLEVFPPPYQIVSYKLRPENRFGWKIIETGEPGVP